MTDSSKLQTAFRLFDELNAQDPNLEEWHGKSHPKELLYAQRMSDRLKRFKPDATEALHLAARAQHLCRWEIPREDFPMDRAGYLKWRNHLKQFHAEKASTILEKVGYDQETIDRVSFLIQKMQLKKDEGTQTLEDVICLVFLEFYASDFASTKEDEKMIEILKKTWRKMSDHAREEALRLSLSENVKALIAKAVAV